MAKKSMSKEQMYMFLQNHNQGFIANVVFTRYPKPARYLRALVTMKVRGHHIDFCQFSMDRIQMDGKETTWEQVFKQAEGVQS